MPSSSSYVPSATSSASLSATQRQKAKTIHKSSVSVTFSMVHRGQSAPMGHPGPAQPVNGLCVTESLSPVLAALPPVCNVSARPRLSQLHWGPGSSACCCCWTSGRLIRWAQSSALNDGARANDAACHSLPFEQTQNCHLLGPVCLCM